MMRFATVVFSYVCVIALCVALPASAATVTSSFDPPSFGYYYSVTPALGEVIKDFHVYAGFNECNHQFLNVTMPPGWNFTRAQIAGKCVITWWTTVNPLPVGMTSTFSYTHYCAPCCHSWFLTSDGTSDPSAPAIDGSWNHPEEPCDIQPPFNDVCGGPGLVVAPIYPQQTPLDNSTWGRIKVLYR